MGIDVALVNRIAEIGKQADLFPGGAVLILGDCKFYTSWASGNNATDLTYFKNLFDLSRAETIDVAGDPTIRWDLHKHPPSELLNQFELIIDAGTLFCCFDIATVLENCLAMLKDRGTIIHLSALTGYFGRCYYNIHPKMFRDFYEQNGFEMLATEVRVHKQMSTWAKFQRKWSEWRGRPVGHFMAIGADALFLNDADFVSMHFTPQVATEAPMLPNDAQLLCAAKREKRSAFVLPIP